jgi:mono/diheme cytochrome c family protein
MKRIFVILFAFALYSCGGNNAPGIANADAEKPAGEINAQALFKINCSQCHMANKDFIGPSLAGVEGRWKNKELLYAFVRNSQEVIEKDAYAKELFIKWKQIPMLPYPALSDEEIAAILAYCNETAAAK